MLNLWILYRTARSLTQTEDFFVCEQQICNQPSWKVVIDMRRTSFLDVYSLPCLTTNSFFGLISYLAENNVSVVKYFFDLISYLAENNVSIVKYFFGLISYFADNTVSVVRYFFGLISYLAENTVSVAEYFIGISAYLTEYTGLRIPVKMRNYELCRSVCKVLVFIQFWLQLRYFEKF